ncbi:hypothetical protein F53441_9789 [Fusarium austroafricanum]|uniref:Ketoreductase domain-containing protein n=1 Tax=Fusarium austroafricanum TaxID=2364996 RepID=A0A8H4KA33_9HYPO|nr:hypothetical protein F53441_9789 [Fusarium austroafricanum]
MESQQNFQTLKGKVALVTGASRGLGVGFAYELARRGAKKIVATYTSPSSEKLVRELSEKIASLDPPSECIGVKADLKDEAAPAEIVRQAVAAFGPQIDILVNNAGMEVAKPLMDLTTSDFDSIFYLNVRAPLLLLQAVKPYLPSSGGGRIINISSVGARCGFKNLSLYCASKAALEGLTRSWAAELGEEGHTVNAVNPGPVQSDMLDNIPKEITDIQKKQTPAGHRFGEVDDIAQIVAWLASEEIHAYYTSGFMCRVDLAAIIPVIPDRTDGRSNLPTGLIVGTRRHHTSNVFIHPTYLTGTHCAKQQPKTTLVQASSPAHAPKANSAAAKATNKSAQHPRPSYAFQFSSPQHPHP